MANELLPYEDVDAETTNEVGVLFAPGDATEVEAGDKKDSGASIANLGLMAYAGGLVGIMVAIL